MNVLSVVVTWCVTTVHVIIHVLCVRQMRTPVDVILSCVRQMRMPVDVILSCVRQMCMSVDGCNIIVCASNVHTR